MPITRIPVCSRHLATNVYFIRITPLVQIPNICVRDSDPLGRRRACAAPLQERRGGAAGAHGTPCDIARPGEG